MSGDTLKTHPPQNDAALLRLAYDDLPAGSDLRRQFRDDGSVAITAPAGEPSEAARRAAAQASGVSAALFCAPGLLIAVIAYALSDTLAGMERALRPLAAVVFAVFSGGIFLLAWRVLYTARLSVLSESWQQSTVLHADSRRLLVETTGPLGDRSYDVPVEAIDSLRAAPAGPFSGTASDPVSCLQVTTRDGTVHSLLPGRHPGELQWVAATLRQALDSPRTRASNNCA